MALVKKNFEPKKLFETDALSVNQILNLSREMDSNGSSKCKKKREREKKISKMWKDYEWGYFEYELNANCTALEFSFSGFFSDFRVVIVSKAFYAILGE